MGIEIIEALYEVDEYTKQYLALNEKESLPEYQSQLADVTTILQERYLLTDKQQNRLDKVKVNGTKIIECLEKNIRQSEITWVLKVAFSFCFGEQSKSGKYESELLFDLCPYAPLVVFYQYGKVTDELIEYIDKCMTTIGLIKMSKVDMQELEESGHFHDLFSL